MKILTTFALDFEFAAWRSLHPFVKIPIYNNNAIYESRFHVADIRVALTGVGAANARKAVRRALEWKPDVCISSGLAGSLRHDLRLGHVFAARHVAELESGRYLPADAELLRESQNCGAVPIQKFLTSAEMVLSAEGKARLGKMAEAVEMESFTVLSEAANAGVPAIAIRAISDAADENLPLNFMDVLDGSGNVNRAKAVKCIARAPHKLPALLRLARNGRVAAKALAEFLDRYVTHLAEGSHTLLEMAGAKRA